LQGRVPGFDEKFQATVPPATGLPAPSVTDAVYVVVDGTVPLPGGAEAETTTGCGAKLATRKLTWSLDPVPC
jgi:hypothetical protein